MNLISVIKHNDSFQKIANSQWLVWRSSFKSFWWHRIVIASVVVAIVVAIVVGIGVQSSIQYRIDFEYKRKRLKCNRYSWSQTTIKTIFFFAIVLSFEFYKSLNRQNGESNFCKWIFCWWIDKSLIFIFKVFLNWYIIIVRVFVVVGNFCNLRYVHVSFRRSW